MSPAGLEVADVVRAYGEEYCRRLPVTDRQRVALRSIAVCRTAELGGHVFRCDACGGETPIYNSCGNRQPPKCQEADRAKWVSARTQELLPVPYFHVVFTVPSSLRPLVRRHAATFYGLLFRAVRETLLEIGADPRWLGARLGFLAILHTWSATLTLHPHVHCIVPGGGPSFDGRRWVACRRDFLAPVHVLSSLFAGKLTSMIEAAYRRSQWDLSGPLEELRHPVRFEGFLDELRSKRWVVYSEPPFSGPETVLQYLARYTHRIAISNARLIAIEDDHVVFRYRDSRRGDQWRTMRLPALEFLRRFLQHVLPMGFVRIRYCGWLANRHRQEGLDLCRRLLGLTTRGAEPDDVSTPRSDGEQATAACCPRCGAGKLHLVRTLPRPPRSSPRGPPRGAAA